MGVYALWAVIVGVPLGVLVNSFVVLNFATLCFVALLGISVLTIGFLERSNMRVAAIFAIVCTAFVGGSLRLEFAKTRIEHSLDRFLHQKVILEGTVVAEPDVRESSVRLSIEVMGLLVGSSTTLVRVGVLAVLPAHSEISYGEHVRVQGRMELPESFDTNFDRQFNYPAYLAKDGITYMLLNAQVDSLGANSGNVPQTFAIFLKRKFLAGLAAVLPEPEAGLAGGITVGDKRSLGQDLTDTFKRVSLIHVVVLSGYNITIVINGLRSVLSWLPRLVQYSAIGSAVLLVVLMTGGAPSAVRAGVMSLIAVYARASARTFIALRILGVVALGMVMWNPMYLAFDPGFQLSILATLGLILFTEPFSARLPWIPTRFGLREIFASTIATQLTVLPLLLYQNGLFSLVALPANLLALIAVPYAMFAASAAALAGTVMGPIAIPLAAPAYALLWYIIAVARLFAGLPFAAFAVPAFSAWWLLGAYILLAIVWSRVRIK